MTLRIIDILCLSASQIYFIIYVGDVTIDYVEKNCLICIPRNCYRDYELESPVYKLIRMILRQFFRMPTISLFVDFKYKKTNKKHTIFASIPIINRRQTT